MKSVTVVISVFNAASTVTQALASVAAQTYAPENVVLVDDGSTDGTADIADGWKQVLPLQVVRHRTNRGVAAGRMSAMAEVDTDLVAALDGDDIWLPHHLSQMLAGYSERPGVVSPRAVPWEPRRGTIAWDQRLQPLPKELTAAALVLRNWLFSGSLFERAAYDAAGGFYRFPGCEDWDLWLRLAAIGVPFSALAEPTVLYRVHDGSISANDKGLPMEMQVLRQFIEETGDPELRSMAHRSLRHRQARVALREAYSHAREGRASAARSAAARSLMGPAPVRVRGAATIVAPRLAARRRDRAHTVPS